jgi:tetratricopeptide (TPR) repeat protein
LLRGVLDTADARIKGQLSAGPEIKANFLKIIGWTYFKIGLADKAIADLSEAVAICRGLPQGQMQLCGTLNWLAYVEMDHDAAKAEAAAREAYALQTEFAATVAHGSPEAHALASTGVSYGKVLIAHGKLDEGVPIERQWLAFQERELGDSSKAIANTLIVLGGAEAERDYRQSLAIRRKVDGGDSPDTVDSLLAVGDAVAEQGELRGAEAIFRQTLDLSRKFYEPTNRDITKPLVKLAETLTAEGNLDEPQKLLQEAMVIWVKSSPGKLLRLPREMIGAVGALAGALDQHGQEQQADALRAQMANPEAFAATDH